MIEMEPIKKLSRDLRAAAKLAASEGGLTKAQARYLVDTYYAMQDYRKASDNQVRALSESEEPHEILCWFATQFRALEGQIKGALDAYSGAQPIGVWARSVKGIGPVIAAGLLAHIDIEKAPTAGHIWRFAGLDPTQKWEKGQKRPWNASLKVLCWKIGESFVKSSGYEDAFYGRVYIQRKALETKKNERGDFAEQAKRALEVKRYGETTEARKHYLAGKLPPAHIHARAKRYAVKLFLAHLHEVWRTMEGLPVPLPYPIAILLHAHIIPPPGRG